MQHRMATTGKEALPNLLISIPNTWCLTGRSNENCPKTSRIRAS